MCLRAGPDFVQRPLFFFKRADRLDESSQGALDENLSAQRAWDEQQQRPRERANSEKDIAGDKVRIVERDLLHHVHESE